MVIENSVAVPTEAISIDRMEPKGKFELSGWRVTFNFRAFLTDDDVARANQVNDGDKELAHWVRSHRKTRERWFGENP